MVSSRNFHCPQCMRNTLWKIVHAYGKLKDTPNINMDIDHLGPIVPVRSSQADLLYRKREIVTFYVCSECGHSESSNQEYCSIDNSI